MSTFALVANQLERQQEEIAELQTDLNSTFEKVNEITSRLAYLESFAPDLKDAQNVEQLDRPPPIP
jgi:hypothetical protein